MPSTNWRALTGITDPQYVGVVDSGSLPKIIGSYKVTTLGNEPYDSSGSVSITNISKTNDSWYHQGNYGNKYTFDFDAARSSGAYWRTDDQVHAYSIHVYFIIKY